MSSALRSRGFTYRTDMDLKHSPITNRPLGTTSRRTPLSTRGALFLATLTVALFVACAGRQTSLTPLLNRGVMPVSEDNPFMGPNLFLAKEMEQSVYLYNFMRDKGAPQGIELKGDDADDVEAHFYYTAGLEEYVAKPAPRQKSRVNNTRREWIIIGPFAVERDRYNAVQSLEKTSGGVFEIFGKREFLGTAPARGSDAELQPVFIPTPVPTKKPVRHKPIKKKEEASTPEASSTPLNFDQQALKEASNKASTDPQGDVVHTVTSKTETLQSIAQWYTSKGTNAKEIATKNSIPLDAKLNPGAKVIIPKALVTNPNKMK